MSPALTAWDAAWRDAVAGAGHVAIPQVPSDEAAADAFRQRSTRLRIDPLAAWEFGQTAGEALAGLDRLRPLYPDLDAPAWGAALAAFRKWHTTSGQTGNTRLAGSVTLTLVSGIVPSDRAHP
jgi:hypothetical protein